MALKHLEKLPKGQHGNCNAAPSTAMRTQGQQSAQCVLQAEGANCMFLFHPKPGWLYSSIKPPAACLWCRQTALPKLSADAQVPSEIMSSSTEIHLGIGGAMRQVINKVDEVLKNSSSFWEAKLEDVMTHTFYVYSWDYTNSTQPSLCFFKWTKIMFHTLFLTNRHKESVQFHLFWGTACP